MTTEIRQGRPRVGDTRRGSSPIVQARLDAQLFERFEDLRKSDGRSSSDVVRDAIAAYVNGAATGSTPRYAELRPVILPTTLDTLRGPTQGLVTLPTRLDWTPKKTYDLSRAADVNDLYRVVIREGVKADFAQYLNKDLLIKLWPTLQIDLRLVDQWEVAFPELTRR